MGWMKELLGNPFLLTALSSWGIAQVLKTILYAVMNKKLDLLRIVGDGGMPSGHSATVSSLATISACMYGTGSFEFGVCLVLAIVVCHDAMGVRLETGKQAVILNEMVDMLESLTKGELTDIKLKEFVGHTPLQVLAGVLVGIVNALIMYRVLA